MVGIAGGDRGYDRLIISSISGGDAGLCICSEQGTKVTIVRR